MDFGVIIILAICIVFVGILAAVFLGIQLPGMGGNLEAKDQLNRMVDNQRTVKERTEVAGQATTKKVNKEVKTTKPITSGLTLEKKLRYALWTITPLTYRMIEIGISLVFAFVVSLKFNMILTCYALIAGPVFMGWLLNTFVNRRFKAFDSDYPSFLLNLVSLLKTGMNVMGAMEAASKTLDEESIVRIEIQLMLERLKYGVSEDKSIGSFAEDVHHEEIELFVQALLLSRRVGGTLSDTLDRLAKQVRKRQYFRSSAKAAVGMQRGSIAFILSIMVSMEVYLYFVYPSAILAAIEDETGWFVWQIGIMLIITGLIWIGQVTKIRV